MSKKFPSICLFFTLGLFFALSSSLSLWAKQNSNNQSKLSFKKKKIEFSVDKNWENIKKKSKDESKKNLKVSPKKDLSYWDKDKKDFSGLEKLLNQQIAQVHIMLRKSRNKKNALGGLWLRLAQHYLEKAKLIVQQKEIAYEERLARYKRKGPKPVRPSRKKSKIYVKKAILLGRKYLKNFPKGKLLEQAYFLLGSSNFEIGYKAVGNEHYSRLVKRFPKSRFVGESYFFRAEYYFGIEKWEKAAEMYSESMHRARSSSLKNLSVYRLAWCYFYSTQFKKGFSTMRRLLRTKGKFSYRKEALRNLVVFYAESQSARKAPSFFKQFGGQKAFVYLGHLAQLYHDQGRYRDSEIVYDYLINSNPLSFKAEEYQYKKVWGRLISGVPAHQMEMSIKNWLIRYGYGSRWFQKNQGESEKVLARQEQIIRNHILEKHIAYTDKKKFSIQSKNNLRIYLQKLYPLYIGSFKDEQKKTKYISMRFFYGELLYDMKMYKEAAKHYLWVSQNQKHPRAVTAGMNALLCAEVNLPSEKALLKQRKEKKTAIPLPSEVQYFINSGIAFMKNFPNYKKSDQVYFKIAFLYYAFNQFKKAENWFRQVIKKYPKSKYASQSVDPIINIYNLRKDYGGLKEVINEFVNGNKIALSKRKKRSLREIYLKSTFELAKKGEKDSNYLKSAQQFESIYQTHKGSVLGISSLFNAAVNYQKANQVKKSISLYQNLIRIRSKNKNKVLHAKSQSQLAQLYQKVGKYSFAAKAFSRAAKIYPPKEKEVVASLHFNAATLYLALGRTQNALYHYKSYLNLSSEAARFQSLLLVAELNEKTGKFFSGHTILFPLFRRYNFNR